MIFFDTETCGLHGPIVLIQWAKDDGPIYLHNVWLTPIQETLDLLKMFTESVVVGFNLAFDWFHVCQTYNTLILLGEDVGFDELPIDHINVYAKHESDARFGQCLKPLSASDIMLHARKGPYQSTMDRKNVKIRRVPTALANALADELEKRIQLNDVYFARRKDGETRRWTTSPIKLPTGDYDREFVDVVLRFYPSSALKALAIDALGLGVDKVLKYIDIEVPKKFRPLECGWAPFATAIGSSENNWYGRFKIGTKVYEGYAWPRWITQHSDHWEYNKLAREYAEKDVEYTRQLYKFFGSPEPGDVDSILACSIGAVRWRGYAIDIEQIKKLKDEAVRKSETAPKAPRQVFMYVSQHMSDVERAVIRESTKRTVLEEIEKWKLDDDSPHPAARAASECLNARKAAKEIELYDKLLHAGRFHASFKVIGTLSSRMSGSDGLNPQGIKRAPYVRAAFPLADRGLQLCGGDFSGFEVSIADAVYDDAELRKQLCTCSVCGYVCNIQEFGQTDDCVKCGAKESRKKVHGLFGEAISGLNYDEVTASKGKQDDWYDKGKRGFFAKQYGGNWNTLVTRLGIDEDRAKAADINFEQRFKGIKRARERITDMFCSMRQPGGIGSQVEWHEPSDYIETTFGFRRYFTLENTICKTLYNLASKLPPSWRTVKLKVRRRDRDQQVGGAVMSALFAAAFNIQSQNMRAAANHLIQSAGATITKQLQCNIWNIQPTGIHDWLVQPMNIHDEIMCPSRSDMINIVEKTVNELVIEMRPKIPLIKIDWEKQLQTWADK